MKRNVPRNQTQKSHPHMDPEPDAQMIEGGLDLFCTRAELNNLCPEDRL